MAGNSSSVKEDPHSHFDVQDLDLLSRVAAMPCSTDVIDMCFQWEKVGGRPDLDTATALLYDRLLRQKGNQAFLETVYGETDLSQAKAVLVGIVPGAFYRQHKHTGADGARLVGILHDLGIRTEIIPIQSFGRVEENARIINEWLRAQNAERVMLVSLSKGGADLKVALRMSDGVGWERVKAWVSLSGLVQGTPLIGWLRRRSLRMVGIRCLLWLRGQTFAAAEDLRHGEDGDLGPWPPLPTGLRLVHVLGFPLRRHLRHPWALRGYDRLAVLGPNDGGGILLVDAAKLPGIVCPLWGLDHFLEPSWDSTPLLRNILLATIAP